MIRILILMLAAASAVAAPVKNVILIVSDDHRYDFMGFHTDAPKWLETPALDRLAADGAHVKNAFVSTSLCSPSRASILSGQYMHRHRVVDNQRAVEPHVRFFPEYLQAAGLQTAFVGKWHMGHDNDERRKGYDYWASFKGQGVYFDPEFNLNGTRNKYEGYNADVTTDIAIDWLRNNHKKRFFLQVCYKAVHYPFQPPKRHHGRYQDKPIPYPATMSLTERNYETQPNWLRERRYGIHGIDHMQTGPLDHDPVPSFDDLYWRFCETVHALDENVGRLMKAVDDLKRRGDTLVIYLGDNGFALGEHGFYDKRDAFEESIRIPMLVRAPGVVKPGTVIEPMIQNIDVAPTVLEAMGVAKPADGPRMDGKSFLPLVAGKTIPWRDHILYEYHWEWNFPAQPTTLAIRTDRYKYVYYHGVWDKHSFHDLETDPHERHNLINIPAYKKQIEELKTQLFAELEASGGLNIPIRPPKGVEFYDRKLVR
ncbi:MAG: sulfatase [Kiritimatiellia bacterium]|jgi:N-acetylglucosamine-6-sulfatase|nr:sulfatase [Kiritimatiellia bacterium]